MKNAIHPNFKIAAWLYALKAIIIVSINLFITRHNHLLFFIAILVVSVVMVLLIAYGYKWMKWVMLATVAIGLRQYIRYVYILYFTNEILITENRIIVLQIFGTVVDLIITVLLFKATKRVQVKA